jgi:hypothetical protein
MKNKIFKYSEDGEEEESEGSTIALSYEELEAGGNVIVPIETVSDGDEDA